MQDFIKIALGVLISALLVGFTFKVIKPSTESIGQNLTAMETNMSVMNDEELLQYSKGTVKGSDVLAAVELYKDKGLGVIVQSLNQAQTGLTTYTNYGTILTGSITSPVTVTALSLGAPVATLDSIPAAINVVDTVTYTPVLSTASLSEMSDKNNINQYIKDTGDFYCRLTKDKNGEISGMVFVQKD